MKDDQRNIKKKQDKISEARSRKYVEKLAYIIFVESNSLKTGFLFAVEMSI